jgi:hypothetical protein
VSFINISKAPACCFLLYFECPEGVKWELGFAHVLVWKMGFHALELGFIKKMGMGLRFEQGRH